MFEDLGRYKLIHVTGPQRCGTTICARMISHDTGIPFVGEGDYHTDNEKVFEDIERGVVQCPGMVHIIHKVSTDDSLVVWMLRDIEEVLESQKRIKWVGEEKEVAKFPKEDRPIALIKLDYWRTVRNSIPNWKEVEYSSLQGHPFWVPRESRRNRNWGPHSWRL